jgi:hypothetical protein
MSRPAPTDEEEFRLLALLWPAAGLPAKAADWQSLDRMARQHRLRPLLHDRNRRSDPPWPVPPELAAEWAEAHKRSALRALNQRAELERIGRAFAAVGVAGTALKGSGFLWRGWVEPALRPMRDLDILIKPEQALAAHALLRQAGFTGPTAYALPGKPHLSGLTAPASGIFVEIHTRLIDAPTPEWERRDDAFRSGALARAEASAPARKGIGTLTATDNLLHIILHAVQFHQFNNGPLLLLDVATLVRHGAIDWSIFWTQAEAIGSTRACQLALQLAKTFEDNLEIDWAGREPLELDGALVWKAAALMLVDMDRRSELGAISQIARLEIFKHPSRLFRLIRRARARRSSQASSAFPTKLTRSRLVEGLPATVLRYLAVLLTAHDRRHVRRSLEVTNWLRIS